MKRLWAGYWQPALLLALALLLGPAARAQINRDKAITTDGDDVTLVVPAGDVLFDVQRTIYSWLDYAARVTGLATRLESVANTADSARATADNARAAAATALQTAQAADDQLEVSLKGYCQTLVSQQAAMTSAQLTVKIDDVAQLAAKASAAVADLTKSTDALEAAALRVASLEAAVDKQNDVIAKVITSRCCDPLPSAAPCLLVTGSHVTSSPYTCGRLPVCL